MGRGTELGGLGSGLVHVVAEACDGKESVEVKGTAVEPVDSSLADLLEPSLKREVAPID